MTRETLVERIKSLPQECFDEIENYIGYILYRYEKNAANSPNHDLSQYFGSLKIQKDALAMQKELRDEWK